MSPAATAPPPADVLDAVIAEERDALAKADAAFAGLVNRLADDAQLQPTADEVRAALTAAGRSPHDLPAAVRDARHRNTLQQQVYVAANVAARLAEIDTQLAEINREFEAARRRAVALSTPLAAERTTLQESRLAGFRAEMELRRTGAV